MYIYMYIYIYIYIYVYIYIYIYIYTGCITIATKYSTPEISTSEIIVDVQLHFPMESHF